MATLGHVYTQLISPDVFGDAGDVMCGDILMIFAVSTQVFFLKNAIQLGDQGRRPLPLNPAFSSTLRRSGTSVFCYTVNTEGISVLSLSLFLRVESAS